MQAEKVEQYPAVVFTEDGDAWRIMEDGERPARGEVAMVPLPQALASPAMLEALKSARPVSTGWVLDEIESAIAAAEGK